MKNKSDPDVVLLKKVAKAAEIKVEWRESVKCLCYSESLFNISWNPLSNDSDAFALANILGLHTRHVNGAVHVGVPDVFWCTEHWFLKDDVNSSTRKAIVRAAAEFRDRSAQGTLHPHSATAATAGSSTNT